MATGSYNANFTAGGLTISSTSTVSGSATATAEETLAVGKSGTLSTRTDANTGVATLGASHGITTSHTVNVFWDGGMRYGMTVTATDATTVTIDGGTGDDLPVVTTAIVVAPQVEVTISVLTSMVAIGIMGRVTPGSTGIGHIAFYTAADALVCEFDLTGNEMIYQTSSVTDFDAEVAYALASNGSSSVEMTLQIGVVQDSTP